MDPFRVRLNCVDHYQASPTVFDPELPVTTTSVTSKVAWKIPILRVFGATETGQKVCAHIHGALPYLYIEYRGETPGSPLVASYINQLRTSIDHALSVSYRRNTYEGDALYVAHITLVKGVPFYGYHVGERLFLKVYMLNPIHITRLADLLRQGAILGQVFQPYESHMQYILQWMCDFNLYGCAYLDCSKVKFRSPIPDFFELSSLSHKWHSHSIPADCVSDELLLPRQSHCSIEVDIHVADITNRHGIKARNIHIDYDENTNVFQAGEKLVQSMAGLWRDETKRRKIRLGQLDPQSSPFPLDALVSVSADLRSTQEGGWIHEQEYRARLADIIKEERETRNAYSKHINQHEKMQAMISGTQTALDSIEDLFPTKVRYYTEARPELAMLMDINDIHSRNSQSEDKEDGIGANDFDLGRPTNRGDFRDVTLAESDHEINDEPSDKPLEPPSTASGSHPVDSMDPTLNNIMRSFPPLGNDTDLEGSCIYTLPSLGLASEIMVSMPAECIGNIDETGLILSGAVMETLLMQFATSIADPTSIEGEGGNDGSRLQIEDRQMNTGDDGRLQKNFESITKAAKDGEGGRGGKVSENALSPIARKPVESDGAEQANQSSGEKAISVPWSSISQDQVRKNQDLDIAIPSIYSRCDHAICMQFRSDIAQSFYLRLSSFLLPCLVDQSAPQLPQSPEAAQSLVPMKIYHQVMYSDVADVPDQAREYAGREFRLGSETVPYLAPFDGNGTSDASLGLPLGLIVDKNVEEQMYRQRRKDCSLKLWEFRTLCPSRAEVLFWSESHFHDSLSEIMITDVNNVAESQINAATQKDFQGFKYTQKQKSTSVLHETQYMSLMSLEVHVNSRGNLSPDPEHDEVQCIFWCLQSDDEDLRVNSHAEATHVGIIALSEDSYLASRIASMTFAEVEGETSELDLLNRLVEVVRSYDPDILTGFEVHDGSWGYLIQRARCKYDFNLCDEISRTKSQSHGRFGKEEDRWGFNHTSTIRVTGRHMINIWRAMRGELNLLQYTMENIVFHICHRRIPHYSFTDLTTWFTSGKERDLAKVINYHISRVQLDLEIVEQNELVPRTSEQARLLGVDFFSVFSRGSQFKVESLMFRIAKPENFLLPSPSRKQVGQQNALECLPLVMEPQSAFYDSPLLVLDFQSLYPSVMIAYNYCYSTFLGRVVNWRGQNKMGFAEYARVPGLVEILERKVNIAPNGMMFVKPDVRRSLLAKMLGEILETRVMVKSGMKVDKDDKTLQRLLNNRQLALKLIANVTYGYTSASFSGRMPCSEIADSIVQTGREILEKAIALIHSVKRWGAEVVYGDTDSLFVYLKGRTRAEAFKIGQEIAKTITDLNPRPIKLKFEKVYHPCILLAKKRYVGFKYENISQEVPDFDAKGIETVRRDGTPAEQKIEEKAIKLFFQTSDLSKVKRFFQRQCTKIMQGKVSIQDFCFAKEVKLGSYSEKGPPPPGALISTRRMLQDPRAEPQYGERVPYVVIAGAPGARLIDRCVSPDELLYNVYNELDSEYYISKNIIPPLERIFNLVGANVRQWYDEMPKVQRIRRVNVATDLLNDGGNLSKRTLESYMKSSSCLVCRSKLEDDVGICDQCEAYPDHSLTKIMSDLHKSEARMLDIEKLCRSCAGLSWVDSVRCDSKDCPIFYARTRYGAQHESVQTISISATRVLERNPDC